MIPKKIWTIWISDKPMPKQYNLWVKTHKIKGYEHNLILLDDVLKIQKTINSQYLNEAIASKKWIKVTDFVRIWYLFNYGGIYLDCDMEVIKPFDDLLNNSMFVGRENDKIIANSIIGADVRQPLLAKYMQLVNENFRGSGNFTFEPAERLFTDLVSGTYGDFEGVITYPSDYFFPLNEASREKKITKNTYVCHHFARSWKK